MNEFDHLKRSYTSAVQFLLVSNAGYYRAKAANELLHKFYENMVENSLYLYLSPGTDLMMAPNNPGVEVEPVWDRNNEKHISYQSKFFDNTPDYQQILHSVEETIKYYAGKIDRVYVGKGKPAFNSVVA